MINRRSTLRLSGAAVVVLAGGDFAFTGQSAADVREQVLKSLVADTREKLNTRLKAPGAGPWIANFAALDLLELSGSANPFYCLRTTNVRGSYSENVTADFNANRFHYFLGGKVDNSGTQEIAKVDMDIIGGPASSVAGTVRENIDVSPVTGSQQIGILSHIESVRAILQEAQTIYAQQVKDVPDFATRGVLRLFNAIKMSTPS